MSEGKERKYVERRGMTGYLKKHATERDSGLPVEVFIPVSNFTFDIVNKVTGDYAGFVVEITCHLDQKKAQRYIPIGCNREQFCHHANKTLGDPDWGGLTTSMSEPAFRQHMVGKQLDFEMGDRLTCKRGTTTVGKVDGENMWIFNNEVHLLAREDERGVIVIEELSQKDQKYTLLPTQGTIWTATITTPLSLGTNEARCCADAGGISTQLPPSHFCVGT
ncbi:uncharacterized protein [Branchiostoma lanceolatum]|uniref:uncharacterized protein n=1 Tax=Branchiostoma lanceolatum TaxID=7740 RepID=UPI003451DA21